MPFGSDDLSTNWEGCAGMPTVEIDGSNMDTTREDSRLRLRLRRASLSS